MNDRETKAPSLETFRINGFGIVVTEPHEFLDQAHAVACLLGSSHPDQYPNYEVVAAIGNAMQTLIELAGLGLARMDQKAVRHDG